MQRYWGWNFSVWILEDRSGLTPNIHLYICLHWYMYISQCSDIGYWEFLRSLEIGCRACGRDLVQEMALISFLTFQGNILENEIYLSPCMESPMPELNPFVAFFQRFFWQGWAPSRCRPCQVVEHVCTRLCAGLCWTNYGWKQLLSQQLGSSQPWIMLL